jgi:phosphoglycerate kinase
MLKFIERLNKKELDGKKVLLRVDFNVPVEEGEIVEVFRIKAAKETIDYLLKNGAKVALVSHIEAIESFNPLVEQIGEILGQTLTLVPLSELDSLDNLFNASPILLVDNIRQDRREVENDKEFARELSAGFDFYVNDAFAVCHRDHTSVSAITEQLPSYAGFLIKKETQNLSEAIMAPAEGKVLVLGGAKISTKLPVIKNFLDKAEKILIGGALANNFFKAKGIEVGKSVVDETVVDVASPKIVLPVDIVVTDNETGKAGANVMPLGDIALNQMIIDIGPKSAEEFAKIIQEAEMVIWNGPMGLCEVEEFANGTEIVAQAVASARKSVVGGGDTIAAANKFGLLDKYGFVSTGGGAMLEFLAGRKLPGLEALGYYK